VEERTDGKTVLEVMKRELGISTAHLKHLKFMENGILVNGGRVTVRYVLKRGDLLTLAVEDTEAGEKLIPVSLPLSVLYEDEDLVIPDKPADMPTHPSCGHYEDTVANALAFRYAERGIPFVFRPINRLDRNTSGLLAVARNRIAASYLSRAMREGEIRKRYLAILEGAPRDREGVIETYMRRTAASVIVRENCGPDEGGDPAVTHYRVICQSDTRSLVWAAPITGRTHQLRVHFSGIGCPLVGDDMYGSASDEIGRHALHSCALLIPLPSDGSRVLTFSSLPQDMRRLADASFGDGWRERVAETYREFAREQRDSIGHLRIMGMEDMKHE